MNTGPEEVRVREWEWRKGVGYHEVHPIDGPTDGLDLDRDEMVEEHNALARAYVTLRAQVEEAEARRLKFDIALQSLTAMGSEFVNNPERCVAYVKERQLSQHELIKRSILEAKAAIRERDEALSRLAKLEQGRGRGEG